MDPEDHCVATIRLRLDTLGDSWETTSWGYSNWFQDPRLPPEGEPGDLSVAERVDLPEGYVALHLLAAGITELHIAGREPIPVTEPGHVALLADPRWDGSYRARLVSGAWHNGVVDPRA